MKTTQLAVVWPMPAPPQNTRQIHQTVWAQTADLLKANLGTLYASFYPASQAWGVSLNIPFGVLLGRDAPTDFVHILAAATAEQEAAIDFHVKGLLAGVNPDQVREVGSTLICPVHLDGTDKELEAHSRRPAARLRRLLCAAAAVPCRARAEKNDLKPSGRLCPVCGYAGGWRE